jgi:hypothetical protein
MKKIFLSLFFTIVIVQTNYSQTLHHNKHKRIRAKSFYKVEVDTCSSSLAIIIVPPCDDIHERTEPQMPGPVFFYPMADNMYKWMLVWGRAFRGISVPY